MIRQAGRIIRQSFYGRDPYKMSDEDYFCDDRHHFTSFSLINFISMNKIRKMKKKPLFLQDLLS